MWNDLPQEMMTRKTCRWEDLVCFFKKHDSAWFTRALFHKAMSTQWVHYTPRFPIWSNIRLHKASWTSFSKWTLTRLVPKCLDRPSGGWWVSHQYPAKGCTPFLRGPVGAANSSANCTIVRATTCCSWLLDEICRNGKLGGLVKV